MTSKVLAAHLALVQVSHYSELITLMQAWMYRAEDLRGCDMLVEGKYDSEWLALEPEIVSNIAKRLGRKDAGAMRLTCRTWQQGVSSGVDTLIVVCPLGIQSYEAMQQFINKSPQMLQSHVSWCTSSLPKAQIVEAGPSTMA